MRPLKQSEINFFEPIFGSQINYDKVRIIYGGAYNLIANIVFLTAYDAIVMGSKIYVKKGEFCDDLGFLAHEMTHIWQYQNALKGRGIFKGLSIVFNSLLRPNPYDISMVTSHSDFTALGYEQQAMVVQRYAEAIKQNDIKMHSFYGNILSKGGLLESGISIS